MSDGATILGSDLAVASRADSGTVRWPFASSGSYASGRTFTAAYGGALTFTYPSHFFVITIADPRVTVTDGVGTLTADLTSTLTTPGTAPTTETRADVDLATVAVTTSSDSTAGGTSTVMTTAIEDTTGFSFNGQSFYERGTPLDNATAVLADCALPVDPTPTTGVSSSAAAAPLNLVPTLQFRPQSLPVTGSDIGAPLLLGAVLLLLGATITVAAAARRQKEIE